MPDPIYRQIAEDLRRKIESGGLGPGSRLPSELELRERYRASRSTVRDALKWLVIRGLVETRPSQGTFVVEKIDPYVTKLTGDPETGRSSSSTQALFQTKSWKALRPTLRENCRPHPAAMNRNG
jgi:GntR family transcriptional regulator